MTEGMRVYYTRPDGDEDTVDVFVRGRVARTQRLPGPGVVPPGASPSGYEPPGPAQAGAPPGKPAARPAEVDIGELNAARERHGLDSAEGSARLAQVIGEKATLAAIGGWLARTGRGIEELCAAAAVVKLPPRRGAGGGGRR